MDHHVASPDREKNTRFTTIKATCIRGTKEWNKRGQSSYKLPGGSVKRDGGGAPLYPSRLTYVISGPENNIWLRPRGHGSSRPLS